MTANKELIKFLQAQGDSTLPGGSMTHWEALARAVWKKALGYEVVDDAGKVVERYAPDKASIDKLFDHMVGKPKAAPLPTKSEKRATKVPIAKRVGGALADVVNSLGESDVDDRTEGEAVTKIPVSKRIRDMAMSKNRGKSPKEAT